MLKRLLSAILTAAMIISLIPASFVSAATTEVENVKLVYGPQQASTLETSVANSDYISNVISALSSGYLSTTYEQMNGFIRYAGHEALATSYTKYENAPYSQNTLYLDLYAPVGQWKAIAFYVPAAGTYSGKVAFRQNKASGTVVYDIFPGDTTPAEISADLDPVVWDTTTGTMSNSSNVLGSYNLERALGEANQSSIFSYNFPEAGEYLLVLQTVKDSECKTNETDPTLIRFVGLSLTNTNGDGSASVPMGITSLMDSAISIGGTTKAYFGDLYGSGDWAAYDTTNSTITYVSSNEKVATVDKNGTVTGKGVGTAEISAVIDGATLVSAPITVGAPSVKLVYDLSNAFGVKCGMATKDTAYYTEISSAFADAGLALNENYTDYAFSNGMWRYYAHTTPASPYTSSGRWGLTKANVGEWFALGFNVPVAGTYDASFMGFNSGSNDHTSTYAVKIFPKGTSADEIETAMSTITWDATSSTVTGDALTYVPGNKGGSLVDKQPATALGISFPTAGEYILVVKSIAKGTSGSNVENLWLDHFILTSDETGILPIGYTKLSSDKIALEKTATASISDKLYNANDWGSYVATGKNVIYASSNPDVATVNAQSGEITANALGTAEITATVDGAQLAPATITVADKEATDEVEKVSFMATSTLGEDGIEVTVTDYNYTIGDVDSSIAPGTTVEVTANTVPGYIFRGWKRGSEDNGVWLTTSSTYSFPLLTNTYLTAIYDVDTATDAAVNVEFYNFNGQFLKSRSVDGKTFGTLADSVTPTLTGYNSFFWTIDGVNAIDDTTVFEKLTRVVAKFKDEGRKTFNVTVPANVTSSRASGTYAYDTEIAMSADDEGLWKVNGEPVAYGNSYTYCVWSEATITFEVKENDNKPIISIDDKTTDGARMISYDANGKNIVEVGILFGSNANIANAGSRAVSRARGTEACGQFTAKAYDGTTTARAYLIYNDNGIYRVIYAD